MKSWREMRAQALGYHHRVERRRTQRTSLGFPCINLSSGVAKSRQFRKDKQRYGPEAPPARSGMLPGLIITQWRISMRA
jgi:hypothetical protein